MYKESGRNEQIEVRPILKMYKYRCEVGDEVLIHKGPIENHDSIIHLIFPSNFEELRLSPFPKNEVVIDSTVIVNGLQPKVQLNIKSKASNSGIFGFVSLVKEGKHLDRYDTDRNGKLIFEIEPTPIELEILSYSTLISKIRISGNKNYQITVYLESKITEQRNGCEQPDRTYPRFKLKRLSETHLESINNYESKTYRQIEKHKT